MLVSRLLKIDGNKSGRIFDLLVSMGMLRLEYDPLDRPGLTLSKEPMVELPMNGSDRPETHEIDMDGYGDNRTYVEPEG